MEDRVTTPTCHRRMVFVFRVRVHHNNIKTVFCHRNLILLVTQRAMMNKCVRSHKLDWSANKIRPYMIPLCVIRFFIHVSASTSCLRVSTSMLSCDCHDPFLQKPKNSACRVALPMRSLRQERVIVQENH